MHVDTVEHESHAESDVALAGCRVECGESCASYVGRRREVAQVYGSPVHYEFAVEVVHSQVGVYDVTCLDRYVGPQVGGDEQCARFA